MENNKQQSLSAKYYENKIKNDAEFYAKEKKRVMDYMKNRYAMDEKYRKRIKNKKSNHTIKENFYAFKAILLRSIDFFFPKS